MQCWVTFKTVDFLWLVDPGTACRGPIIGAVESLSLSFLGFFVLYINSFLLYIKNGSPYVAVKRPTLDRELEGRTGLWAEYIHTHINSNIIDH